MSKSITVYTNDSHKKAMILKIKGPVETVVQVSPRVVRLTGKVSEKIETTVKITPEPKYPLAILSLKAKEGKNIAAGMNSSSAQTGSWDIVVRNIKTKPGRYFDMLTLKTDSTIQPEIKINVFGNITE